MKALIIAVLALTAQGVVLWILTLAQERRIFRLESQMRVLRVRRKPKPQNMGATHHHLVIGQKYNLGTFEGIEKDDKRYDGWAKFVGPFGGPYWVHPDNFKMIIPKEEEK